MTTMTPQITLSQWVKENVKISSVRTGSHTEATSNGYRRITYTMFDWNVTLYFQGRRVTFEYHMGEKAGNEPDVEGTVNSILLDAQAGEMEFNDFCDEFGYEPTSTARKIYNKCVIMRNKVVKFFGADYEMVQQLENDI